MTTERIATFRDEASLAPGSARSVLFTMLGELVWPTGTPVWTAALLQLFRSLGIEEQAARQAIARAAASGWIEPRRQGREVAWALTPQIVEIFEAGSARVYSLSDGFSAWDGTWLTLNITVPSSHRARRRPLYAGLTWAGFGNPAPGLWLSPHTERGAEVGGLIAELGLTEHTLAVAGPLAGFGIDAGAVVARGWDLDELRTHYRRLQRALDHLSPAPGEETLHAHIQMLGEWRRLPRMDPQLPEALLPDWIGRRVARRIEELRDSRSAAVHAYFAEINAAAVPAPDALG